MIPVVTAAQMRRIDEKAISGDLTTGYSYMMKAGMGLFAAARRLVPEPGAGEVAVFCGRGNNGGDGYEVARLLLEAGYRVMCFSLCKIDELKGEARLAYKEYTGRKGNVLELNDTAGLSDISKYRLLIDAMLGTGTHGDPHGWYAAAIKAINESGVPVLAADTPSGLNNDTGIPGTPCINAAATVTMGFPKIGLYFYPGRSHVGNLIIQDLGYPDDLLAGIKNPLYIPDAGDLKSMLPLRRPAGSKFDHGLALLVCGSKGMTGSAALASAAALRAGCGMAHLAVPESILPILSGKLTETVLHSIPETKSGTPARAALGRIRELAGSMQALCVGPGISHEDDTCALVRELVSEVKIPLILDADGLNAFKDRANELKKHSGALVITPHTGEWRRVFGGLPSEPTALVGAVCDCAREYNAVILLKGASSIAADTDGNAYMLQFGNSSLAKAGSGDVLSGIIVSLLAQGALPIHAAILGAFIHGQAGTITSARLSEYSVVATDLIDAIPQIIMRLCRGADRERSR